MIQLYLIRHAVAEERGDEWPDDTQRPLSEEGRRRMQRAAKGLVKLGVRFDVVVTSPLVRTRQTAGIVAGAFGNRPPIVQADSLAPEGTTLDVLDDLERYASRKSVALVGHEPNLGMLAAHLAGSPHPFGFKKGAVCRIDVEWLPPSAPGALRWFVTPAILRALAR